MYETVTVTLQTYPDTIGALYNRVLERVEQESANPAAVASALGTLVVAGTGLTSAEIARILCNALTELPPG